MPGLSYLDVCDVGIAVTQLCPGQTACGCMSWLSVSLSVSLAALQLETHCEFLGYLFSSLRGFAACSEGSDPVATWLLVPKQPAQFH